MAKCYAMNKTLIFFALYMPHNTRTSGNRGITTMSDIVLETQRLSLRKFELTDAPFIIELLNSPGWLQHIGDKKVSSVKDAELYLKNGPLKSYADHGFGLWMVEHIITKEPIGICGLIKRDYLDDVDIGFAMLPKYFDEGYGLEIASATLIHAKKKLGLKHIVAITTPANKASIKLLNKIGLNFEKPLVLGQDETVLLFSELAGSG